MCASNTPCERASDVAYAAEHALHSNILLTFFITPVQLSTNCSY